MLRAVVFYSNFVVWLVPVEEGLTYTVVSWSTASLQQTTKIPKVQACDATYDAIRSKARLQKTIIANLHLPC